MMHDLFGISLKDEATGKIQHAKKWRESSWRVVDSSGLILSIRDINKTTARTTSTSRQDKDHDFILHCSDVNS